MGLAQIAQQSGLNIFSCSSLRKIQTLGQRLFGPFILAIAQQRDPRIEPDRWRRSPRNGLQIARSRLSATSLVEIIFARGKVRPRRSRLFHPLPQNRPALPSTPQSMRALVEDERRFFCEFAGREQREQ